MITQTERKSSETEVQENDKQKLGDLVYNIMLNEDTGKFIILLGDRILFRGVEGQFSVLELLTNLNIKHTVQRVVEVKNDNPFKVKDDGTIIRNSESFKVNEMKEKITSSGNSQPSNENYKSILWIIIIVVVGLFIAFLLLLLKEDY